MNVCVIRWLLSYNNSEAEGQTVMRMTGEHAAYVGKEEED